MDEFWTACCQATQIYLATTCLQCEWTAQHTLLPGSHGYRHLMLFHTFVGPVNQLCSPYLSASTDCLALSFLSDHYLCPTTFSTDTEKTWEGRSVICFQDTTQTVQVTPHPASVSPLALLSLICCIAAPCASEERAHKGPCAWHRAAALVTRLAGSGVWVHIKNNIQSSPGFCLCKQHKDTCFFNSFFVLSVVSQSLPPPSVDACHHLPTFHVDMSLNYLSWENWTESLVTPSGQTCWAGVLKPADVGALCVSQQGTSVCEELLYLQKSDLASHRSFSLMKNANVTCLQGWWEPRLFSAARSCDSGSFSCHNGKRKKLCVSYCINHGNYCYF